MGEGAAPTRDGSALPRPRSVPTPRLLVELDPWGKSFLENLGDLAFRREPPPVRLTFAPGAFWPDVFVASPLPWRSLGQSVLYHAFALVVMVGLSTITLTRSKAPVVASPERTITYYDVSEYLPALDSGSAPAKVAKKGEPEHAKQPIISLPPSPDNSTQTVVDPTTAARLPHEVPLPNMVIWTPVPARMPVAATARSAGQISLPTMPVTVAAAPPEVKRNLADVRLPKLPEAAVVEAPPDIAALDRKVGDIYFGHIEPTVGEPKLPVAEQRAVAGDKEGADAAPPAPTAQGAGSGMQAMGQLIALGVHPTMPTGPVTMPEGNRSGVFAATPEGKAGAPGTPDVACCGNGPGGTGTGGAGGPGSGSGAGNPSGVYVGGPSNAGMVSVVAANPSQGGTPGRGGPGGGGRGGNGGGAADDRLLAAARSPDSGPPSGPATIIDRSGTGRIEDEVFGPKRYYSMTINMPNLSSAGGSWIMRFAELAENPSPGQLSAPVVTSKSDPGYPAEIIRKRIEGTVTLYAVIHRDGSVGEVRVLRGIDDRLDENARAALAHWRFRPATKNGEPVELEAVIYIPFAVRRTAPF
jgi:TonB family protein